MKDYGQPLRIGKYGAGASDEARNTLFRAVSNIAGDCATIIPESMMITVVENQGVGLLPIIMKAGQIGATSKYRKLAWQIETMLERAGSLDALREMPLSGFDQLNAAVLRRQIEWQRIADLPTIRLANFSDLA